MDRNMIDVANGGVLGNITPAAARQLIENMASNSQQFGTRSDAIVVRGVHDVGAAEYTKKLECKIDALTTLVNQLASNQRALAARVCGLCTFVDHFTDSCLALQQQAAASSSTSLEELVRMMTLQNMQFQQETRASIQSLTNQMGQMATQLNQA